MFNLLVVYTSSDKKYTLPLEVIEKVVDKETLEKIKTQVLKEIQNVA